MVLVGKKVAGIKQLRVGGFFFPAKADRLAEIQRNSKK